MVAGARVGCDCGLTKFLIVHLSELQSDMDRRISVGGCHLTCREPLSVPVNLCWPRVDRWLLSRADVEQNCGKRGGFRCEGGGRRLEGFIKGMRVGRACGECTIKAMAGSSRDVEGTAATRRLRMKAGGGQDLGE